MGKERTYEMELFCDLCDKDTMHKVYETGHERDSSNDWSECLECGGHCRGIVGEHWKYDEGVNYE